MLKIDSKKFNFSFFLSNRKKVNSLEEGAITYGGATQFDDGVYSNYSKSEYIKINKDKNSISLFVPSTVNVSRYVNNSYYVNYCYNKIKSLYNNNNIRYYDAKGSWCSEDLKQIIIEDITIITLETDKLTEKDIEIFIQLANWIKQEMQQEGVSIAINTALAIVWRGVKPLFFYVFILDHVFIPDRLIAIILHNNK